MAKILKIHATRTDAPGVTHYTYPPEYDAKKIQVLAYESDCECKDRDDGCQCLIGIVADADADQFLASKDIHLIDETEACECGERWRPQVEIIANQNAVISVLAKSLRAEKLTINDMKAIDPADSTPGINKSKSFTSILEETKSAKRFQ